MLNYEELRRFMVMRLKESGYVKSKSVEEALLSVPRELFLPDNLRHLAYEDKPLPIGEGQTISAPSVVARMTELLDVREGQKVLEVGTGSGYQAAIVGKIVGPKGHVWTIERLPGLAEAARRRLEALGLANVTVVVGDGTEGLASEAPFDRIIVTAAAPEPPQPLIEQLREKGVMVIPVGSRDFQRLEIIRKGERGEITVTYDIDVIFVPLVGKYGWPEG